MTIEKDQRTGAATSAPAPRAPYDLRVDGRTGGQPGDGRTGSGRLIDLPIRQRPVLGWQVDGTVLDYEVEVARHDGTLLWRSGQVESAGTSVRLPAALEPLARYSWSVRHRSESGTWSAWAQSGFETGPLVASDWTARWVTLPSGSRLRKRFSIDAPVDRARLYLTGQGLLRAELNGAPVEADLLVPTRTDSVRALYRGFDVGDLLIPGENSFEFVVALGELSRTGAAPRLLAQLVVWSMDGTASVIVPDEDAEISASRVVVDDPFYLERHDIHAEQAGRWRPIDGSAFATATDVPRDPPLPERVEADPTPPARVVARLAVTEIGRTAASRVYDAGANVAGRSRVVLADVLAAGTTVRVIHGEHVGADGHIDTTNLTMPFDDGRIRQVVEWVASGEPGDTIEAWFAYHGFRYIEVFGLPDAAQAEVTVGVLHTDLVPSGRITTDSETVRVLLERAERTLLNNLHGVPEDCPTREQSAWTGDTASVAEYELAAFDSEDFLSKWIRDLVTSQADDGGLPAIAPDFRTPRMPADPVWGAALHRLLLGHWLHYGDSDLVRDALPALRRWADFQLACVDDAGIVSLSPISYGHDWLALEQTPPEVHHTAATIDCLLALGRLEAELGDPIATARRFHEADALRAAALARFFDPSTGVFANGSQGAYAIAIEAGMLRGDEATAAAQRIEDDVRTRGNRISGGFATTRTIVRALTSTGRSQVIADMLEQPAEPGIGAMLASGPGTFWECWWIDPANTGTGSLDHVGLGGVFAAWVWEGLAGLAPTSGGYRTFTVAPRFVSGVDRLTLSTATPRGEVRVAYRIQDGIAHVSVHVPDSAVAAVELPGREPLTLRGGTHELQVPVVRTPRVEPPAEEPWSAPAIASRSGDVTGSRTVLADALASGTVHALPNCTATALSTFVCMPIPHAQPEGPVLEVAATVHGAVAGVGIDFEEPLRCDAGGFVYALVDLCDERWVRGSRPVLRLIAADGSERRGVGGDWPAGWNRVAVDVGDWTGGAAIVAAVVTLDSPHRRGDDNVMPAGETTAGGFHLGELGVSAARRTW